MLHDPSIFESQPKFLRESMNRDRWFWRWDTPEKYQHNVRNYFRMISGIDNAMGRVLSSLHANGLDDNTVVIYAADNGYYMGNRGFAGKWSHYEESLRIPLIISSPFITDDARGTRSPIIGLNIDIPATICDFAGIPVPTSMQGQSLRDCSESTNSDKVVRRDFFCEHLMRNPRIPKWEGVRQTRWVYARYFEQQPVFEFLHDLESDPQQLVNLAGMESHKARLQELRNRCNELRESVGGEYSLEKFPPREIQLRKLVASESQLKNTKLIAIFENVFSSLKTRRFGHFQDFCELNEKTLAIVSEFP